MVASILTPADVLARPPVTAKRQSPALIRDFAYGSGGMRFLQATGAEIVAKGIDTGTMSFAAVISTADVDRVGDILIPKGCDLESYRQNPIVFLNHESEKIPIGVSVDAHDKLYIAVEPDRVLGRCFCVQGGRYGQEAADIFQLIVDRAFNDVSVGFNPHPDPRYTVRLDTGGSRYEKWELLEWSVVGIGCNRAAKIIRKYLTDGRITGKHISPRLVKMLTPLAEPKTTQVTSGFAPATPAPAQSATDEDACPVCKGKVTGRCRCWIGDKFCENKHTWHVCPVHKRVVLGSGHGGNGSRRKGDCTCSKAKRMSKKWGKPGRSKRHKAMSESSGTAGGYVVTEEPQVEEKPEGDMDHERVKADIAGAMEVHGSVGHEVHYKAETGEVHHMHPEGMDEEHLKAIHEGLSKIDGVKAVHQAPGGVAPEGGYEQAYPPDGEETEAKAPDEEPAPEEKLKAEYTRKAQLAFHVGRGKAYRSMAKMLPKKQKDALEECVHRKIPKIAEDHPEMEASQREAVAFSMCGEKAFGHDEYEHKEEGEEQPGGATPEYAPGIPADTEDNKYPPSLTLCQQAIENIEAALPGLEPETRDFWEDILQQIRDHGMQRYPQEDFGGAETKEEPTSQETQAFADEVTDSYHESPEQREERESRERLEREREAEKHAWVQVRKSMRTLRRGNHLEIMKGSADHHHEMGKKFVGYCLKPSDLKAFETHGRGMDKVVGAVEAYMKKDEEEEPDEREMEEATGETDNPVPEAPDPQGTDDEAPAEVEKLFATAVEKAVNGGATAEVLKGLDAMNERLANIFGTRF